MHLSKQDDVVCTVIRKQLLLTERNSREKWLSICNLSKSLKQFVHYENTKLRVYVSVTVCEVCLAFSFFRDQISARFVDG